MPEPTPPAVPSLSYATDDVVWSPGLRRACAAAMLAAGLIGLCRFGCDTLFTEMEDRGWNWDALRSGETIAWYLSIMAGAVSAVLVIAGIVWWRRGDRAARVLAKWTLFTWLCVAIAEWASLFAGDVRYDNLPDNGGEVPFYAADLLGNAMPIVLPALLWWIARRTTA